MIEGLRCLQTRYDGFKNTVLATNAANPPPAFYAGHGTIVMAITAGDVPRLGSSGQSGSVLKS